MIGFGLGRGLASALANQREARSRSNKSDSLDRERDGREDFAALVQFMRGDISNTPFDTHISLEISLGIVGEMNRDEHAKKKFTHGNNYMRGL